MSDELLIGFLYVWPAIWCGMIAWRLPEAPPEFLCRFFGSMFLGLMWPVSLPMHWAYDIKPASAKAEGGA